MKKGLVSVLFLSMNHEKYVEQGARSVVNQTWPDIEILFVDNNSKDRTFEVADEIFRNSGRPYKGFKRTENHGISANLNFILKQATGEFIAVLSGDDWWDEKNLHAKVPLFGEDETIGLVHSNGKRFIEQENLYYPFFEQEPKTGYLFKEVLKGNLFYSTSIIFRHSALKNVGYFDETLAIEDWDMNIRIAEKYQVAYTHQPLTFLRVTGNNISLNIDFMTKGYDEYYKKYAQYPEMNIAKRNIILSNAFTLAYYNPGYKTLKYLMRNFQWNKSYLIQVARCLAGMAGIRFKRKV